MTESLKAKSAQPLQHGPYLFYIRGEDYRTINRSFTPMNYLRTLHIECIRTYTISKYHTYIIHMTYPVYFKVRAI